MTLSEGDLTDGQTPQFLNESLGESLTPSHARRLRAVHRSAGWPCCDPVEVDLVAAGLLERRRSALGHETVHVTAKGLALIALPVEASAAVSPHDALVHQVAREMTRNGRLAWCGLRLRLELQPEEGAARWGVAKPDVFSIRNTSVEGYAQPVVHQVIVDRADLMAHLAEPDAHAVYRELGGECWYVLGQGEQGDPIATPQEIPKEYGVLERKGHRLAVIRSATHRARPRMPFAVWLALAKTQPLRGADEGVQGVLGETGAAEP
jgi:hypothetical protein